MSCPPATTAESRVMPWRSHLRTEGSSVSVGFMSVPGTVVRGAVLCRSNPRSGPQSPSRPMFAQLLRPELVHPMRALSCVSRSAFFSRERKSSKTYTRISRACLAPGGSSSGSTLSRIAGNIESLARALVYLSTQGRENNNLDNVAAQHSR